MAVQNKTAFCKKFDIDITEDDWPCIGLPEVLTADRGELLTHQTEALEKILHIRIENTPAYRGDLKPIVERYFKTIQSKFKFFVPGEVTGVLQKKRGWHRLPFRCNTNDYRIY